MSFTKNLNKALLIGAVLIGEIVNGNCASFVSPMTHIALPQTLSPNSIEQLPKKTQNNLFTTAIGGLADQKFLNDYLDHMDESERTEFLSRSLSACINILSQINRYGTHITIQIPPIQTSQQIHESVITSMPKVPLKSIAEFNKDLDLVPIMVDDIGRSGKNSSLLKRNVNNILSQFVEMHSKDQDYADINFLIGLLKMLHRFPNELPTVVTEKIPDILKSLDCPEITDSKTAKEAIYDYIVSINEESLGEFHI